MEGAGLLVGIASLYRAVLRMLEKANLYRKFGAESRFSATRLHLDKALIKAWAQRAGITGSTRSEA
jgi:hypothetical protein